ncbi:helix-turn-helix domain-containing protein [Nocardioides baculatus]|uniref:Helix-turn-helix domain-containing protein n=1 Tax=Nocardioides baculatus TaxID=2801337 RepID=A0ABS1LB73_9ACTN|nr:helix-turn-helix domain-containing protein [Nocardioides baculatus]MBL0748936.1 helix-turn-helix domain-containing protein [Nocardioides baculatus]
MPSFLDLLYDEAPLAAFDEHLAHAERGLGAAEAAALRAEYDVALRLRDLITRMRSREAELSALYETASDLTAIRDVDTILAAIVRRARQLLHCDMTYLSLNDAASGASFMKVTDGALTREFQNLRLPLGTGLLGLVAQTGAAYFTEDYATDDRFVHKGWIDEAVAGEQIRAILGVPLVLDGVVIGALLAVHRSVRRFPQAEVSLLTSFAAHAVVALENARLFAELDEANRSLTRHTEAVDAAALAHDRLTDLLIGGGGVAEVAEVLSGVLDAAVSIWTPTGELEAGEDPGLAWTDAVAGAVTSGRSVAIDGGLVAAARAGTEHVATLVVRRDDALDLAGRRTLERGALVTALVLLFARSVTDAEERLGGQLLADLLEPGDGSRDRLRDRVRRHSASLDGPLVVAAAAVDGADPHRAGRAAVGLARRMSGLAGEHRGVVVAVVPGDDPRRLGADLQAAIAAAGGRATVGVAATDDTLDDRLVAAHAEARRCLDTLLRLGRLGEVSDPAGLGVARLLLGDNDPEHVAAFVDTMIGPVREWDERRGTGLVDTLEEWFASGGRLKETASALHVHPNTVTQRLERIGELLGDGWREPARSLDLQLALRLARLRDA